MTDDGLDLATLLREMFEAFNAHDVERLVACYAADYEGLDASTLRRHRGHADVRAELALWFTAFPNLAMDVHDVILQPGRVAFVWTMAGTHAETFLNVPASGHRVELCGMGLLRVAGGKIASSLYLWDMAGLLRTMRLLPELPGEAANQAALLTDFLHQHG